MATHSTALRRAGAIAAAVLASALVLSGCASGGSAPAAAGGDEEASYGEVSVQYSWIKNEEFAGEFYAYENGYYDEAGFSDVVGVAGPDTGMANLLSGSVQFA